MKFIIPALLAASASAFVPASVQRQSTAINAFTIDNIPGALAPVGYFDPLGFGEKANEATLKRYREAELTHGRVAMLATVGFLVGEKVDIGTMHFQVKTESQQPTCRE